MELVRPFAKLDRNHAPLAGGKGASLGEMTSAGIPVPPGFVVLADTFEKFLTETDLHVEIDSILHKVNHQEIHTVERAAEDIKALILAAKMPADIAAEIEREFKVLDAEYVAVRSSATAEDGVEHAWAGQLESYLNVTKDGVLEKVQHCWASLFTPRAIFYRFEKGLHGTKISVAVVVQKMVISEVSGIAFSVHPVTEDYNQLIIEAGFGLGEAIVSGQITPDSYVVEKSPRNILDINVATQTRGLYKKVYPNTEGGRDGGGNEWLDISEPKASSQVLTGEQILELSTLILKIENHYGFPCDIEWAFESGKFYIVQSRPITTLSKKNSKSVISEGQTQDALILLGAWNVLPLEAWRWFDAKAINHLFKLTGVKLRVFTYVKDDLHYQCVFQREVNELQNLFEKNKDQKAKEKYVETIYADFYKGSAELEAYLNLSEKKEISQLSTSELIDAITQFADLWTAITNQVWYALFIDMWYPLPEDQTVIKGIAAKARDQAGRLHEKSNLVERKVYTEAAKRLSLDTKGINYLFPEEIVRALNNEISYSDEIKRREKFCVTALLDLEYKIYSGDKAQELFETYNPPKEGTETKDTLSGSVACKGKVVGKARIIRRDDEFVDFKDGEILVALQTMIHYLPIMKKADAILTEFGGMTSHAAIVSRELKKPCIVGVANLLASIGTGDMVEVDADQGTVRILEKTEKQSFRKAYTRNFSIIMQEVWFAANKEGLIGKLNFKEYPYDPPGIYFMKDGVEEVWENAKNYNWLIDKAVEKFQSDPEFFPAVYKQYFERLAEIESWYKKDIQNVTDLKTFIAKVNEAASDFLIIYVSLLDDRVPKEYKDLATKFRDKDSFFADCNTAINKALKNIYPDLGYLTVYITQAELDQKIDKEELKKRDAGFALIPGRLMECMSFADLVKKFPEYTFTIDCGDGDENGLKGQTAYKGKVSGRVKIIKRTDQVNQVLAGDIIISPMTTPDMLPAMKQAAAFVTDEGGITCHAAIIAREMKKPCIIGTKVASQLFKDGDMVEVDADNGVVRILDRKTGINPEDYYFYGLWRQDLFSACFWVSCFNQEILNQLNLSAKEFGALSLYGGNFFCKHREIANIQGQIKQRIKDSDKEFFANLKKAADSIYQSSVEYGLSINAKPTKENFEQFLIEAKRVNFLWCFAAEHFVIAAEEMLQETVVKEKFPAERVAEIIPPLVTPLYQQHNDLMALKKAVGNKTYEEIKGDKALWEKMVNHCNKYPWIEIANFIGDILVPERLYEQIIHAKDEPKAESSDKPELSKELAFRADCMGTLGYIKQAGAEYFGILTEKAYPLLHAVADELGLSYREFLALNHTEILEAFDGKLTADTLKKRAEGRDQINWLVTTDEQGKFVFTDDINEVKGLVDKMVPKADKTAKEIKGDIGNPGKIRGTVRKIMNIDDFGKMQTGEILVTTMTTPDFVILMHKASAIVTDIGGMLCHAAIVSREINKPCIIGTRFATQMLKDGDEIEVDADKGIVRILK